MMKEPTNLNASIAFMLLVANEVAVVVDKLELLIISGCFICAQCVCIIMSIDSVPGTEVSLRTKIYWCR
jgi:hypothetical protein